MRITLLALLLAPLAACDDSAQSKKRVAPPSDDFAQDHWVRITSPFNGMRQDPRTVIEWTAGADIAGVVLEANGAVVNEATLIDPSGLGAFRVDLEPGNTTLRLVGLDAGGAAVSEHSIRINVVEDAPWVTLSSPADGAVVPNPVRFAVTASAPIDQIEIRADDWSLGTVSAGELLTYEFSGTGFEREIEVLGFADGELVASDAIRLTVTDPTSVGDSSFNDLVMGYLDDYPTDGSYAYWWPSGVEWGGNPHDIYYMGELFSAGDPEQRSFCVGLTFEVFMRAFDAVDRAWGGDGSLNGIDFDELYTFRTDWYVRDLYGMGIVDAMDNYGIGQRVTDWAAVQPGDFVQFWRHSGSGHNVVFIDWLTDSDDEIVGFTYWSTQGSTDGVGTNDEYFGASGGAVDASHFYAGRVADPDAWLPWY